MPNNKGVFIWLAFVVSIIGYVLIGYDIQRHETAKLLTIYSILFTAYLYFTHKKQHLSIRNIIGIGILFRLIFLFSMPSLSDDFYRFIWDGRLWFNGINPFAHLPNYYINNPHLAPFGINRELYQLLNSPTHYTIYPSIPQFINWIAAWFSSDSIWLSTIVIRISHILAEIGTLFLIPNVLKGFKIDQKNSLWYALNPLIIIELTGNLHHEAIMIFFIMLFLANFQQKKIIGAAFALAMAVAAKLLPLIFLPYILLQLKIKERFRFIIVFVLSLAIVFAPLLEASFFRGIEDSLLLYYQKFEFNAGIYYVFREVGYWFKGYNMISLIGKIFALIATISIVLISIFSYLKKRKIANTYLWISTLFALFSLILHPWYIALVILFATMTNYRFGILWSLLIMGSYAGYGISGFEEHMGIIAVEFIAVVGMILYELKTYAKPKLRKNVAPSP